MRIPEKYIRYQASTSALWYCALAIFPVLALYAGATLILEPLDYHGIIARPEPEDGVTDYYAVALFIAAPLVEVLVYLLVFKKRRRRQLEEALDEAALCITDPKVLAELSGVPPRSQEFYESVIRGYQDFMAGMGYAALFFLFPTLFLGVACAALLSPLAALLRTVIPYDMAYMLSFVVSYLAAGLLWYRFGYYKIYRRGRIRKMQSQGSPTLSTPRPGPYK
jgi:hypothetical protein